MAILVTGASGFVGSALIPLLIKKGHRVYGLSRHPPIGSRDLIPIVGDVTEPNLGLKDVPEDITAIYHLAGIHTLNPEDKDGLLWKTNVDGTTNVLDFCLKHDIPRLYFTSTAYTQGRNVYEQSKAFCEWMVNKSNIPKVTVFKPSIIMGTEHHLYPGHFVQFVLLVVKAHQRAEVIRRKIEGSLRLPAIEPVFRIKANPEGKLNLVPIDAVANAMAEIEETGTYWLTNPNPPTMQQILEWVGEFIMVKMRIEHQFDQTPIEAMVWKMGKAFQPYLWGDQFPSDLKNCEPIGKEFIRDIIKGALLG